MDVGGPRITGPKKFLTGESAPAPKRGHSDNTLFPSLLVALRCLCLKAIANKRNLNTHKKSSLYERFEPAEAKRIADKLEIHHTPKHGSWLNMAEIEMSVMTRQCLSDQMDNISYLQSESMAYHYLQRGRAWDEDIHYVQR